MYDSTRAIYLIFVSVRKMETQAFINRELRNQNVLSLVIYMLSISLIVKPKQQIGLGFLKFSFRGKSDSWRSDEHYQLIKKLRHCSVLSNCHARGRQSALYTASCCVTVQSDSSQFMHSTTTSNHHACLILIMQQEKKIKRNG